MGVIQIYKADCRYIIFVKVLHPNTPQYLNFQSYVEKVNFLLSLVIIIGLWRFWLTTNIHANNQTTRFLAYTLWYHLFYILIGKIEKLSNHVVKRNQPYHWRKPPHHHQHWHIKKNSMQALCIQHSLACNQRSLKTKTHTSSLILSSDNSFW